MEMRSGHAGSFAEKVRTDSRKIRLSDTKEFGDMTAD